MTTWGLIGSGHIGSTVARLAVDGRPRRGAEQQPRARDAQPTWWPQLGPHARAATADRGRGRRRRRRRDRPAQGLPRGTGRAAARQGRHRHEQLLPPARRHIAELDDESTTTSELLQRHLPGSHVVKAFNNIYFEHLAALARPVGSPDRSALAIAGDDADAKALVTGLLDEIGYDTVDLGPLAEGWRTQRDTAAYAVLYAADPADWSAGPRPVAAEEVAAKAAESRRYRDS